jgi:hypothetical protein
VRHFDVLEHEPSRQLRMSGSDRTGHEAAQGMADQVDRPVIELP